jgi:hypothetical protein
LLTPSCIVDFDLTATKAISQSISTIATRRQENC